MLDSDTLKHPYGLPHTLHVHLYVTAEGYRNNTTQKPSLNKRITSDVGPYRLLYNKAQYILPVQRWFYTNAE